MMYGLLIIILMTHVSEIDTIYQPVSIIILRAECIKLI